MKVNELDSKWITPSGLAAEMNIPLSTITTWISKGQIPVLKLPGNSKKRRYMVDKTNVPPRRAAGRPFG